MQVIKSVFFTRSNRKSPARLALTALLATTCAIGIGASAASAAANKESRWVKVCAGKEKKICITRTDSLDLATGRVFAPVFIEMEKGKKEGMLRITLPHFMPVPVKIKDKKTKKERIVPVPVKPWWIIQAGAKIKVDKEKPVDLQFIYCYFVGCVAQVKLTPALLATMKKSKIITIAGKNRDKPLFFSVPLTGFAQAIDGKPMDAKVYAQIWQKKLAALEKRQAEFMKKARAAAAKKAAEKKK